MQFATIRTIKSLALATCATAAFMGGGVALAQDGETHEFEIAAQDLGDALAQFSVQGDAEVYWLTDEVAGKTTVGLNGSFTKNEAVEKLLGDAGVEYRIDDNGVILVGEAYIRQASLQEKDGPFRVVSLAQEEAGVVDAVPERRADEAKGDVVIVTGTRLPGTADSPATVVTFDRQQIRETGASQVRDVLRYLPQASTSFDESGAQGFLGASAPQLRGLSPGSTLMLLNGRRLNVSGAQFSSDFFDVNQLPLTAIDKIEVLTDSASAVYGADAIGGAINYILLPSFDGVEVSGRVGTSYKLDATESQVSLVAGGEAGIFSGLATISGFWRSPVEKSARRLTADSDFSRFGGLNERSSASFPGNVYSLTGGPLPGLSSTFAGIPTIPDGNVSVTDFVTSDGSLNLFEPAPFVTLVPRAERFSGYFSGSANAAEYAEFYAEALYSESEQLVLFEPAALRFGEFGVFVVGADNPFNPFAVDVGLDYRFPRLGSQTLNADTHFLRLVGGVRGELGAGFSYDMYFLHDEDSSKILNGNKVDFAAVQDALLSPDPATAFNPFAFAGQRDRVERFRTSASDQLGTGSEAVELVVRGPLFELPAGPLQLALGGTLRWENIDIDSPLNNLTFNGERKSQSLFAESSIPLISADMRITAIHRLQLTAAVRYDHFDGGVDTTNPQVGLLWSPVGALSLRATYGTAFKIPSLYNLFSPMITFDTPFLDPARGFEIVNIELRAGGNRAVEPENAESWTLGMHFEPDGGPLSGLHAEAKYFNIDQGNFVQTFFDPLLVLDNPEIFADRIIRAAPTPSDVAAGLPGRLLALDVSAGNFGNVHVEGIDVEIGYAHSTKAGDFSLRLLGSYIDKYELRLVPGVPAENVVDIANQSGFPVDFKATGAVSWDHRSGLGATFAARYRDSYRDFGGIGKLPAQTLFDLQLRFDGDSASSTLAGWRASFGIANLTNKQADFASTPGGYDPSQTDMRGRFYSIEIARRF